MDLILDLLATVSRWSRSNLSEIALALRLRRQPGGDGADAVQCSVKKEEAHEEMDKIAPGAKTFGRAMPPTPATG